MHVKALRSKLEEEAISKDSETIRSQAAVGKADPSCPPVVSAVARSAQDLQYLFTEGTESSVWSPLFCFLWLHCHYSIQCWRLRDASALCPLKPWWAMLRSSYPLWCTLELCCSQCEASNILCLTCACNGLKATHLLWVMALQFVFLLYTFFLLY